MTNPMTAEEALQETASQWIDGEAFHDIRSMSEILASLGYALHPIKIDEAAVETAAKQAFCEKAGQHQLVTYLRAEWINQSRAIITAYHEALVRTR